MPQALGLTVVRIDDDAVPEVSLDEVYLLHADMKECCVNCACVTMTQNQEAEMPTQQMPTASWLHHSGH